MIKDLTEAQNLLPDNYSFTNNERVRANKYAATALLARTYLHMGDWTNAELQATQGNKCHVVIWYDNKLG